MLTPLQELEPGLYLLHTVANEWAILRLLIDDADNEQIIVTEHQAELPVRLLVFFTPVGLRMNPPVTKLPH